MNLQQQFDAVSPSGGGGGSGRSNRRRGGSSGSGNGGSGGDGDDDDDSEGGEGGAKQRLSANPLSLMSKMAGAALSGGSSLLSGPPGGFVAAKTFAGAKAGFEFKAGSRGLGYYLTASPLVSAPAALRARAEAAQEAARAAAGRVLAPGEQPNLAPLGAELRLLGSKESSGGNDGGGRGAGASVGASVGAPAVTAAGSGAAAGRNAETPAESEMHRRLLRAAADEHLERLVLALVKAAPLLAAPPAAAAAGGADGADGADGAAATAAMPSLAEQWQRVVVDLARRACATVDPDVRKQHDLLDIRAYVKIKTIPGGRSNQGLRRGGAVAAASLAAILQPWGVVCIVF
jgi:hypothetical protein